MDSPCQYRYCEPRCGSQAKHHGDRVGWYPSPDNDGKCDEPDASHRCSGRIKSGCLSGPQPPILPCFFFLLPFMLFDQRRSGGKDCRECQEQAAHARSPTLRYDSGERRHCTAKGETDDVFVPLRTTDSSKIDLDLHESNSLNPYNMPNAIPIHKISARLVTGRTGHFLRIKSRVTTAA